MKTLELDHRLPFWLNALLNRWPFCLHKESIRSIAWSWGPWGLTQEGNESLFYNGYVFLRLSLPFYVGIHLRAPRWSRYFQAGIGWKLNARFAITFRFQTDESAARGTLGPNFGQAQGMERGPK